MNTLEEINITPEEEGERLDKILARRFTDLHSRTYLQMLFEEECVLVNGSPVKKRFRPKEGDEIEINFIASPEIGLLPEPIPLDILYEDDHLIAINKPAGMVVHPATGNWTGTLVNGLLHHCDQLLKQSQEQPEHLRPGIVHRLDKNTSGVILAAKTPLALQKLIGLFQKKQVYKEYLAVCLGNPGDCEINAPIGRHPVHRQQMTVTSGGKTAQSSVKTIAYDSKFSLIQVVIATGRTHQIRVHLKHKGIAILGDSLYGNTQANEKYGVNRQLLHARRIRFTHPMTDEKLDIEAPIPADFQLWVDKLTRL